MKSLIYNIEDMFDYLNNSISPYHAVANSCKILRDNGFIELSEQSEWELEAGGRYYVVRNQSSVIAFVMPVNSVAYYHVSACHSDSPTYVIKKSRMSGGNYARAEVEGYGGMIHSSWFDRPLGIAGRVMIKDKNTIRSELFGPDMDACVIPNLAIHMNREVNNGYKFNINKDMQPLYGTAAADLDSWINSTLGLGADEEILATELSLYVRQRAVRVGTDSELIMAPRIDDLACAYTTLIGFLMGISETEYTDGMPVWCMFDNEEVGSGTSQGALSDFLVSVLRRAAGYYNMTAEAIGIANSRSLVLSADNGHALHPNYPEMSDSEHPVVLGGGVVLKYNANQKYTTNASSAAVFKKLCSDADVRLQEFYNRSDMPGGSTLGNLLSHTFSTPMVDIGLPQLAMHSAVETAAVADAEEMVKAVKAFYSSSIHRASDNVWSEE